MSCGRVILERKTGLNFSTFLRVGQAVSSKLNTSCPTYNYQSSGFDLLAFCCYFITSSQKNVRGDLLLKTENWVFFQFLGRLGSGWLYCPGPRGFSKQCTSLKRSFLAQLEFDGSLFCSRLYSPGPTFLWVLQGSENLPLLKIHWCCDAISPSLFPLYTLQSEVCFSFTMPSQAPGPGVSCICGTNRCALDKNSGFPLPSSEGALGDGCWLVVWEFLR